MKTLQMLTDEELVKAYEQGCNEAFEVLLCRHKDKLYNYIYSVTHNESLTDDIFQDTFFKVITTIRQHRYVDNGKFGSWLARIAHNLIIDNYRRNDSENTVSTDENEEMDLLNDINLYDDASDSATYESALINLGKLVELLPDNQRRIVEMRFYKDLSFKDIADIEEISINTALGRMRYAVMNLRKLADERNIIAEFESEY